LESIIAGRDSQGASNQDELFGGKSPVVKSDSDFAFVRLLDFERGTELHN
jgi:hypothetical protein